MNRSLLPLLLALPAAVLLGACDRKSSAPPPPPAPPVTVAKPIVKKVVEWDEFVGRLESPQIVEIRPRVSGYLEKVHFQEGAEVKQNDLLFTIDPRPYQAQVDRAAAERDRARARVELARGEAGRVKQLLAARAISTEESEARLQALNEAEASLSAAQAALAAAELDLKFTEIRAPIAGKVSYARVTAGNLVSSGGNGASTNATLLTTIVALDPLYCYFEVDEQSALKYRQTRGEVGSSVGAPLPAEMGLANEKGFPRKGRVDFVDNALRPETGTIRVRAVFENKDKMMAPGFFARVRIPGTNEYDALLIRDEAIGSDQGRAFVFVAGADNKAEYRPIEVGPMESGLRIVRGGLKPDEKIVINGVMNIRNGAVMRPEDGVMNPPPAPERQTASAR